MAFSITSLFSREQAPAIDPLAHENAQLLALKHEALANAHALAKSENRAPNLTDYFRSALSLTERAETAGVQWNARVIADLSNLTLDGFTIRKEDIYPDAQQRAAMRDVMPVKSATSNGGRRE